MLLMWFVSSDKQNFTRTNIAQMEDELDMANKQMQHLREEIHSLQTQVFKLEASEVGLQVGLWCV